MQDKSFWFYHSGLPEGTAAAEKTVLSPGSYLGGPLTPTDCTKPPALEAVPTFQIRLFTEKYAPNHRVTVRTEVGGWGRDIPGSYWGDSWFFHLESALYPNGVVFKFLLEGCHWMVGANLTIPSPQNRDYQETQLTFPVVEARYRHYYDNLLSGEDAAQQEVTHSNYDESVIYDVIIVGSGMGGGTLASRLSPRGRKVLLLDAGRLEYPTHLYNLPSSVWYGLPEKHWIGHYTCEKGSSISQFAMMNFGGRSVYWSGLIPQMKDWELGFWPSAVATYLKNGGYVAAEKLMRKHVTTGSFADGLIQQLQAAFPNYQVCDTPRSEHQPNLGKTSFIEQSTGTFSAAELLYDALTAEGKLGRDNLTVNLGHLVTRLEWKNNKIEGVVCQDLIGNRERTYRAKTFVLAAGSIETPKIALRSNLKDPNQRIGVGLTDHPAFFTKAFVIPASNTTYAGKDKHARVFFYADGTQQHRFNVEVLINGDYWRVRHASDELWQDQLSHKQDTIIELKFSCASPLIDSNYVKLGVNSEDKARVKMDENPFGRETRPTVEALGTGILQFFGVQNFDLTDNCQMWFGNGGTPAHAGGSMRMSADGSGVVDTDLKHEGYDNLYVCDPSVYPFIPAANPSLTLVALALRLDRKL